MRHLRRICNTASSNEITQVQGPPRSSSVTGQLPEFRLPSIALKYPDMWIEPWREVLVYGHVMLCHIRIPVLSM